MTLDEQIEMALKLRKWTLFFSLLPRGYLKTIVIKNYPGLTVKQVRAGANYYTNMHGHKIVTRENGQGVEVAKTITTQAYFEMKLREQQEDYLDALEKEQDRLENGDD